MVGWLPTSMDDEEQQWKDAMERIEGEASADDEEADGPSSQRRVVPCELPVAREVAGLQQQALQQIGSTAQKVRKCLYGTLWRFGAWFSLTQRVRCLNV